MSDPVTLSGGDLGGEIVDGTGWADGEIMDLNGYNYRRIGSIAVFVGIA